MFKRISIFILVVFCSFTVVANPKPFNAKKINSTSINSKELLAYVNKIRDVVVRCKNTVNSSDYYNIADTICSASASLLNSPWFPDSAVTDKIQTLFKQHLKQLKITSITDLKVYLKDYTNEGYLTVESYNNVISDRPQHNIKKLNNDEKKAEEKFKYLTKYREFLTGFLKSIE